MCYIQERQRKQIVLEEGCILSISTPIESRKNGKRDKPNQKAELWVQARSKEGRFKGLQTVWSFRSKEGTWKQPLTTLKTWQYFVSKSILWNSSTCLKAGGGEIFHAQWTGLWTQCQKKSWSLKSWPSNLSKMWFRKALQQQLWEEGFLPVTSIRLGAELQLPSIQDKSLLRFFSGSFLMETRSEERILSWFTILKQSCY